MISPYGGIAPVRISLFIGTVIPVEKENYIQGDLRKRV
jgi:hypothetical protein